MAGMPRARDTEGSEKDPPKQSLLLLFPGDELLIIFQCSRRISDITEQYLTFVSSVLVNYWSSLLLNTCSTLLLLSAPPLQFPSLLPPPSLPTSSPYPTFTPLLPPSHFLPPPSLPLLLPLPPHCPLFLLLPDIHVSTHEAHGSPTHTECWLALDIGMCVSVELTSYKIGGGGLWCWYVVHPTLCGYLTSHNCCRIGGHQVCEDINYSACGGQGGHRLCVSFQPGCTSERK